MKILIAIIAVLSLVLLFSWYNRPNNGIHGLGRNVCLLEGECVMFNWDASEEDAEAALRMWKHLRYIEQR